MQEICRIGQNFLHISFIYIEFRPILCQICVGNVRKCHVLVSKTYVGNLIFGVVYEGWQIWAGLIVYIP